MPSVFLLEEAKHGIDVKTAEKFGAVRTLFGKGDRRPSVFRPNDFGACVLKQLDTAGFDPDADMFLLTGSLVCISVAVGCIMTAYPSINLLLFSSVEGGYVMRRLSALDVGQIKDQAT